MSQKVKASHHRGAHTRKPTSLDRTLAGEKGYVTEEVVQRTNASPHAEMGNEKQTRCSGGRSCHACDPAAARKLEMDLLQIYEAVLPPLPTRQKNQMPADKAEEELGER